MRVKRALAFALAAASLALACASSERVRETRFPTGGDYELELARPGGERSFIVHLPPDYPTRAPLPVLFAFHGGGGNAAGFQKYAGLDAPGDARGFAVVYPNGSGRFAKRLLTWNAGDCCAYAQEHDADDVGFALAILADLARDLPLDRTRVYATGHSNGGMMSYRLAAEAAMRIAAIVPVAGADMTVHFAPAAPVAVLHVHSVDDPRALYAGGLGPANPLSGTRIEHRAVEAGLARWRARDGCTGPGRETDSRALDRHTAVLIDWAPCSSGYDVAHWKLAGPGHGWPGGGSILPERIVGPNTEVIEVAEEIFRFVARYARPDAPPLR
jgi:polyhydroxybutyrate depolymerase